MGVQELLEEAKFEMLAGRYEQAASFLERALKQEPNNIEVLFNLGLLNEITHKHFEALHYFKKVLELDPDHSEAKQHAERLAEF